ncbi:MAG: hypothetical protein ACKOX3_02105 [Bacteroidota bacterium]
MKYFFKTLLSLSVLLMFSCGESKLFSTENTIVHSDNSLKPLKSYLNFDVVPELISNINSDFYLLDYQGYNLLYNENFTESTFNKKQLGLYKTKIFIRQNLFMMDDIYSNINLEKGTEGYNRKILIPLSKIYSENILNSNFRKEIFKVYPKFQNQTFMIIISTMNNNVIHTIHLYFSKNTLVKMEFSLVN